MTTHGTSPPWRSAARVAVEVAYLGSLSALDTDRVEESRAWHGRMRAVGEAADDHLISAFVAEMGSWLAEHDGDLEKDRALLLESQQHRLAAGVPLRVQDVNNLADVDIRLGRHHLPTPASRRTPTCRSTWGTPTCSASTPRPWPRPWARRTRRSASAPTRARPALPRRRGHGRDDYGAAVEERVMSAVRPLLDPEEYDAARERGTDGGGGRPGPGDGGPPSDPVAARGVTTGPGHRPSSRGQRPQRRASAARSCTSTRPRPEGDDALAHQALQRLVDRRPGAAGQVGELRLGEGHDDRAGSRVTGPRGVVAVVQGEVVDAAVHPGSRPTCSSSRTSWLRRSTRSASSTARARCTAGCSSQSRRNATSVSTRVRAGRARSRSPYDGRRGVAARARRSSRPDRGG